MRYRVEYWANKCPNKWRKRTPCGGNKWEIEDDKEYISESEKI